MEALVSQSRDVDRDMYRELTRSFLCASSPASTDANAKHSFILLENTYNNPTVILDHSVYPSVTSCSNEELVIRFSSLAAYKVAAESWSRGQTLVTHSAGCAATNQATKHSYWSVLRTRPDVRTRSIKVQVQAIDVNQAIEATDVSWGSYTPILQGHLEQRAMDGKSVDSNTTTAYYSDATTAYTATSDSAAASSDTTAIHSTAFSSAAPYSESTATYSATAESSASFSKASAAYTATESTASPDASSESVPEPTPTDLGAPFPSATPASSDNCRQPPAATVDGFPTAPLCEDFDDRLDEAIGYLEFDQYDESSFESTLQQFAPGLDEYSYADLFDPAESTFEAKVTEITKRASSFGNFFTNIATKVAGNLVPQSALVNPQSVPNLGRGVQFFGKLATGLIDEEADSRQRINWDATVPESTNRLLGVKETHWGKGAKLFDFSKDLGTVKGVKSSITLSATCVNCKVSADIAVKGAVRINFRQNRLETAQLQMFANVQSNISIALELALEVGRKFSKELLVLPVPGAGVGVADVFSLGLAASVAAELELKAKIEGGVLLGLAVQIPSATFNVDFVRNTANYNNFDRISATRSVDLFGKLTGSIDATLPINFGFGLRIPKLEVDRSLVIIVAPGVGAEFKYTFYQKDKEAQECKGLAYDLYQKTKISANLIGIKEFELLEFKPLNKTGCK